MPPARLAFYAATLAGIVLSCVSIATVPPPLGVAVVAIVGYVALLLAGVFSLRLRMFADAVVRGPEGARGVVLTFDDGPHPEHTRKVLDVLDVYGAKATFFVIGRKVEKHPEVVREIVRRGHDVGVHGFSHDRWFSLRGARRVRRDLERAVRALEKLTRRRPSLFRPPIGHTNPTIARVAEQLDLTVVGWTVAARDGLASTSTERAAARVARGVDDGCIVLLHDASERDDREPVAVSALPAIFSALKEKNLRVVRLRDWLASDEARAAEELREERQP